MIAVVLRDLRVRLGILVLICCGLYLIEPAFHQHGPVDPRFAGDAGPLGISATLAYLSALSMILLLAGFISTDARDGYAALYFSQPVTPQAYYGLRWVIALGVTLAAAVIFLIGGQLLAWGEWRGGAGGMLLALLAALVYGGLIAFFSALLRGGDGWIVLILFLPTPFPVILNGLQAVLPASLYSVVLFLLPPQHALQEVYRGLLLDAPAWGAAGFAAGYGLFWLVLAGLLLRLRPPYR